MRRETESLKAKLDRHNLPSKVRTILAVIVIRRLQKSEYIENFQACWDTSPLSAMDILANAGFGKGNIPSWSGVQANWWTYQ